MKVLLSPRHWAILGYAGAGDKAGCLHGRLGRQRVTQSIPSVCGLVGGQGVAWIDGEEAEVRQALDMVLQVQAMGSHWRDRSELLAAPPEHP